MVPTGIKNSKMLKEATILKTQRRKKRPLKMIYYRNQKRVILEIVCCPWWNTRRQWLHEPRSENQHLGTGQGEREETPSIKNRTIVGRPLWGERFTNSRKVSGPVSGVDGNIMYESFEEGLKCVGRGQRLHLWVWRGEHGPTKLCVYLSPAPTSNHGTSHLIFFYRDPGTANRLMLKRLWARKNFRGWTAPKLLLLTWGWPAGLKAWGCPLSLLKTREFHLPLKMDWSPWHSGHWVVLAALPQTMETQ